MPQKRHTVDQIVAKLRKVDVELGKGNWQRQKVPEICKLLEVTEQTYYRWRLDYNHHCIPSLLGYQTPAALPTPILSLNLVQRLGVSHTQHIQPLPNLKKASRLERSFI